MGENKNRVNEKTQDNTEVNHEQTNLPQIRFSDYEDCWIEHKLGDLCDIYDGTHSTPKYTTSGIPFFSVETITTNTPPKYISKEEHEKLIKRCHPQKGDILLTRIGTLAKSKLITWDDEFSIYVSLALLKSININPKFLNQYIETPNFQKDFLRKSLLLAVPQKINLKDLKTVKVKIPTNEEQNKIGNFLSLIDKKIELLEQTLNLYKKHFRGLRNHIMPKNKSTIQLKDICTINKGKQLNKSNMVKNGKFYVLNGGKNPSGYTNLWNVEENTITISEGGNSCGYVSFNYQQFYCGGHCYYLTLKNSLTNKRFLYHYLKFKEPEIMRLRVGSGLPNIQKGDIENIKIPEFDFENQINISKFLDNLSNNIYMKKRELNFLYKFKKGLLQKMFC